ncbi:PDZ domain-containing protein [Nocardioides humilatus]|uniref:endopeptidase La n=1 Tax=Nocardioides humilatus TaxID=2607660 RepID=A0A5B1LKB6_9ACTN|nr:PDZ domain-containing protein [Nocardioides humilatus]KAA1421003.1 PDZ domain-containing protein [Nocardioides humilatus]
MSQRWIAFAVAAPLTFLLFVLAAFAPLPYSVYSPGPTFDVLGKDANESEIIQVVGHKTYRDDGQIRFTTVSSSARGDKETLLSALDAWLDPDEAVIPYDIAHPPSKTADDEEREGAVSMVGSQDAAIATAMRELGYKVKTGIQVAFVDDKGAAFGELRVRDKILKVDGKPLKTGEQLVEAIQKHGPGDPVTLLIERNHKELTVELEPEETVVDGDRAMRIGITPGIGYDFPFDVTIQVDPTIGGPSAGLMFSLAVYDTLTPGSLTDGAIIAGTGTIDDAGSVGPIGGIEQKIAGAGDAGAQLFFVPKDNCSDVKGLDTDMELVKAETMHGALEALKAWTADHDADLPRC